MQLNLVQRKYNVIIFKEQVQVSFSYIHLNDYTSSRLFREERYIFLTQI